MVQDQAGQAGLQFQSEKLKSAMARPGILFRVRTAPLFNPL
jgi:hypothetical protein